MIMVGQRSSQIDLNNWASPTGVDKGLGFNHAQEGGALYTWGGMAASGGKGKGACDGHRGCLGMGDAAGRLLPTLCAHARSSAALHELWNLTSQSYICKLGCLLVPACLRITVSRAAI